MFLETSAKTAFNVEEVQVILILFQAFNLSAQNILTNIEKNKMNLDENVKFLIYNLI